MQMVKNQQRIEQIAGLALIGAIVVGCGFVLRPFVLPILWAAILCFATWPLYELLLKWLHGRHNLAADDCYVDSGSFYSIVYAISVLLCVFTTVPLIVLVVNISSLKTKCYNIFQRVSI